MIGYQIQFLYTLLTFQKHKYVFTSSVHGLGSPDPKSGHVNTLGKN